MAFLIPEAIGGGEALFGASEAVEAGGAAEEGGAVEAKTAESAVPKMEEATKPAEAAESSSLSMKDLFLYNSLQQKPQPVVINNQNNIGQPVAPAIPVIEPPTAPPSPVESKNEKDNDIVNKANNNIIKIEKEQLTSEKNEIVKIQEEPRTKTSMEKLEELMNLYNKNLYMFKQQQERLERFY